MVRQSKKKASANPPDVLHYSSLCDFLPDYLKWRKDQDPTFSHRGFAKNNHLDHSYLQKVIAGTHHLSPQLARKYKKALGISEFTRSCHFLLLAEVRKIPKLKFAYGNSSLEGGELLFSALVHLRDFRPQPEWVARKTKGFLSVSDAKTIIKDLMSSGRLVGVKGGWKLKYNLVTLPPDDIEKRKTSHAGLCNFQMALLKRGKYFKGYNSFLPLHREAADEFFQELWNLAQRYDYLSFGKEAATEIYGISVSMTKVDLAKPKSTD